MILDGRKAGTRYRDSTRALSFPFTAVDVPQLVETVRRSTFGDLPGPIHCHFTPGPHLACILTGDGMPGPTILIHNLINRPETPQQVFHHIAIHELIHLVVRPEVINGERRSHPPRFWDLERELSPHRDHVWVWLFVNFAGVLVKDLKNEAIRVKLGWRRTSIEPRSWESVRRLLREAYDERTGM